MKKTLSLVSQLKLRRRVVDMKTMTINKKTCIEYGYHYGKKTFYLEVVVKDYNNGGYGWRQLRMDFFDDYKSLMKEVDKEKESD